jgi:hypothetical protein
MSIILVFLGVIAAISWFSYSPQHFSSSEKSKKKRNKKKKVSLNTEEPPKAVSEATDQHIDPKQASLAVEPRKKTKWTPLKDSNSTTKEPSPESNSSSDEHPDTHESKPPSPTSSTTQNQSDQIPQQKRRILRLKDPSPERVARLHPDEDGFKKVKTHTIIQKSPETLTRVQKKNQKKQEAKKLAKQLDAADQQAALKAHRARATHLYIPPSNAWNKPADDVSKVWE